MKRIFVLSTAALTLACNGREAARADSARAAAAQQVALSRQLAAQKDSLTGVVLEADRFIARIDSQISTVKGLPKRKSTAGEDPLQAQLHEREEMLARVNALVARARGTASQLADARRREKTLRGENASLRDSLDANQRMIADLSQTIERQTATIAGLTARADSLLAANNQLGSDLLNANSNANRAYYVIGRESDLLKKGVIVREGGANLLVARVGRTLQPARTLDRALFTAVDQRELKEITVPDSTKRYRLVSRQTLDAAEIQDRDRTTFRGNLRIADAERFWSASRYLILVEQ
jgi:hypothetical protein